MIEIKQLQKTFQDGTHALKNIELELLDGELTCIIGPSGCGKTTLLKHINRLISPTSGDIEIDGESIFQKDIVELRRSIGYVIQQIGLFPHMTIAENISVVPRLLGWSKRKINDRVDEMLNMVNLEPDVFRNRYPLELSGGQQQRVGVARALVGDPDIILMDEPFSALDPISREQLQDQLRDLHKQLRKTIVFVTHDMDEALKIADRIVILKRGEVEQIGTPDTILTKPKTGFVESFIGEERMKRYTQTSERTLKNLRNWFIESYDGTVATASSNMNLRELSDLLVDQGYHAVKVTEDGSTLGYLTKDQLLKAMTTERGGSS